MGSEAEPFPIPFAEALAADLPTGFSSLQPEAVRKLERYAGLLLDWNRRFNLTAIRDPREVVRRHFAEPLVALDLLPPGRLLDIGSGAGFPGLPLQIVRCARTKDSRLVLVEASEKKSAFLRAVVEDLGVPDVTILTRHVRRVEDLHDVVPADGVTMRAVPAPEKKLRWLPRLLGSAGVAVLFLGQSAADTAERGAADLGLGLVSRRLLPGAQASWIVALRRE